MIDAQALSAYRRLQVTSQKANRALITGAGRAEAAFAGISRSAIGAAAGIAGLGAAMNKVRTSTDSFKTIENRLRSIGQESDEAFNKLLAVAVRSRTPIEELSTSVARIQKATGDGYEATLRRAETLNKLLAVGGATAQEVSSVMTQLSQALTSGTLQGDELRSLREAAPIEILDAIAKAAGVTRGELKKMGEEGQLTSDIIIKALDSLADTADEKFSKTAQTTGQAMTNINSALVTFVGRVDEGLGSSEGLIAALNDLSGWLVDNADEATELGQSLGAMFDVANDRVGEFLSQIDGLATSLRTALDADPIDDFGDAIDRVIEFVADLNGVIEGSAAVAKDAFLSIADNVGDGMAGAINAVIAAVEAMVNGVLEGVRTVASAVDGIINSVSGLTSQDSFMGRGMRGLLGDVGTSNLAGSVGGNVSLGSVSLGPRASSGKSLGEVYSDARDAGPQQSCMSKHCKVRVS